MKDEGLVSLIRPLAAHAAQTYNVCATRLEYYDTTCKQALAFEKEYQNTGKALSNIAFHEIGHQLGLVELDNLLGTESDEHDNPEGDTLPDSTRISPFDIMTNVSITDLISGPPYNQEPVQVFRPIDALYLLMVAP